MMLPARVYQMCVHGALIVGSYAKLLAEGGAYDPKDFDLLVPTQKWQVVALLIPSTAKPNKFGGWRFKIGEKEVDVWPGTMHQYLAECKTKRGGAVYCVDYINNKVYSSRVVELFHPWEKHEAKNRGSQDIET